ncbi:MAG: hypothetical protein ACRDSZ_05980 [Pseudonocardiaceae bacterium]
MTGVAAGDGRTRHHHGVLAGGTVITDWGIVFRASQAVAVRLDLVPGQLPGGPGQIRSECDRVGGAR